MNPADGDIVALVRRATDPADPTTSADAVATADPTELDRLQHPRAVGTSGADGALIATGLAASPGVASGVAVFDCWRALDRVDAGEDVILVRPETSPADEPALAVAVGVVTARGGLTSHAAVVARGRGLPAVCGASSVLVGDDRLSTEAGAVVHEGERITIDGSTGEIRTGATLVTRVEVPPEVGVLLGWADDQRAGRVAVRANADTAEDAVRAAALGADGVGLCRTEHQFLGERLPLLQDVILADGAAAEQIALDALERAQRSDFESLLEAMDGRPVAVRLLDPPLHEFLPDLIELTAAEGRGELSSSDQARLVAARRLHEHNPMLGVRGVRLAVRLPELARLQLRALLGATVARRRAGGDPRPQVVVPMVVAPSEVVLVRRWLSEVVSELGAAGEFEVPVGAMIETPRAALLAGALAEVADFLSVGTNDLTQLVFGFSRDDVGPLVADYLDQGLLDADPFASLDGDGVGALIVAAVRAARAARPGISISVCGEHAGDPSSIHLLVEAEVNALSCSPLRLAVTRLATAQALGGVA